MTTIGPIFFVWFAIVVLGTGYFAYYQWKHKKFAVYTTLIWSDKDDPLLTSAFASAFHLCIWRTCVTLFVLSFTIEMWISEGFRYFQTFTVWNWLMIVTYFCIMTFMSWWHVYLQQLRSSTSSSQESSRHLAVESPNPDADAGQTVSNVQDKSGHKDGVYVVPQFMALRYFALVLLLIQCVNAFAFIVVVIVWCVLLPLLPKEDLPILFTWYSIIMHSVNLIVIYVDLVLCRVEFNTLHMAFPAILVGIIYIIFQWVWVQINPGNFVYDILDTRIAFNVVWYVLLLAMVFGFFKIAMKVTQCRQKKLEAKNNKAKEQKETQAEENQTV